MLIAKSIAFVTFSQHSFQKIQKSASGKSAEIQKSASGKWKIRWRMNQLSPKWITVRMDLP
ncbi:hypothetical protein LTSEADE_2269 [Salmonella enterica subsp. enterica serovar Adelaide str. A4-669]|uniref:Uncharacterized protein n=1 Tax=Salmonella enterica subsp. enterica serovar Adelaide str. A4-669 TaxID=913063 RepID=A0A6C8GMU0_SALET|nr:hypothetical protein LTSEADE_2269 [Salmonella enterica subsp. enterica serovar Adelaide str. A4-669]